MEDCFDIIILMDENNHIKTIFLKNTIIQTTQWILSQSFYIFGIEEGYFSLIFILLFIRLLTDVDKNLMFLGYIYFKDHKKFVAYVILSWNQILRNLMVHLQFTTYDIN